MSPFLVNGAGLLLMAAIVWWFWLTPAADSEQHDHH